MEIEIFPEIQLRETFELSIQSKDFNRFESALGSSRANFSPLVICNARDTATSLSSVGAPDIATLLTENTLDQPSKYEPTPKTRTKMKIKPAYLGGRFITN